MSGCIEVSDRIGVLEVLFISEQLSGSKARTLDLVNITVGVFVCLEKKEHCKI